MIFVLIKQYLINCSTFLSIDEELLVFCYILVLTNLCLFVYAFKNSLRNQGITYHKNNILKKLFKSLDKPLN